MLEFLKANPDFDGKDTRKLQEALPHVAGVDGSTGEQGMVQNLADYVKIEALLYEELYQGLELNELHYEAARLQARLVENFVKTRKTELALELESADGAKTQALLGQAKRYDALLNQVKGAANAQSQS